MNNKKVYCILIEQEGGWYIDEYSNDQWEQASELYKVFNNIDSAKKELKKITTERIYEIKENKDLCCVENINDSELCYEVHITNGRDDEWADLRVYIKEMEVSK